MVGVLATRGENYYSFYAATKQWYNSYTSYAQQAWLCRAGESVELKLIKYLIQVVEFGSFSKAATVVGIAQPALGRQIQKLEEECGARLLYRHGRGISLTPDGERFLETMRPLVRQWEAAVINLQNERTSPAGLVTVGMTPTICNLLGMPLIASVRRKYPKLRLNIVSGYSGYVHEWLASARLDLAILHDTRRSQHVAVEHLADAALSLMSSPALLSATENGTQLVSLRNLETLPLVLPTKNHGLRRTLELAASRLGFRLNVQYEMDNLNLMKEIAMAGLAHTVLAVPAAQREVEAGRLVSREICDPQVETRLMLAKASNRPLTKIVRLVERETKNALRQVLLDASSDLRLRVAASLDQ